MTVFEYVLIALFLTPFIVFLSLFVIGEILFLYFFLTGKTNMFDNEGKRK